MTVATFFWPPDVNTALMSLSLEDLTSFSSSLRWVHVHPITCVKALLLKISESLLLTVFDLKQIIATYFSSGSEQNKLRTELDILITHSEAPF